MHSKIATTVRLSNQAAPCIQLAHLECASRPLQGCAWCLYIQTGRSIIPSRPSRLPTCLYIQTTGIYLYLGWQVRPAPFLAAPPVEIRIAECVCCVPVAQRRVNCAGYSWRWQNRRARKGRLRQSPCRQYSGRAPVRQRMPLHRITQLQGGPDSNSGPRNCCGYRTASDHA
jgi:hypothetical protein